MATSSINAIPTHPDANSYVTESEATQYFDDRLASSGWSSASDDDKKKALMEATRRVDRFRFHFGKQRTTPEQPLEFPRSNCRTVGGGADSGSTTTTVVASEFAGLEQYPDDYFIGWALEFLSGDLDDAIVLVTDFDKATGTFTFATQSSAPSSGDSFQLIEKIPTLVKYAVLETALWLVDGGEEEGDPDVDVKSHRIGNFAETFVDGFGVEVKLPRKAYAYLQKYISRIGTIE